MISSSEVFEAIRRVDAVIGPLPVGERYAVIATFLSSSRAFKGLLHRGMLRPPGSARFYLVERAIGRHRQLATRKDQKSPATSS
jgi:hypothetical protein